jgi:8-oxo-dGTP pyrophosphatase MutT (NUDIX family)
MSEEKSKRVAIGIVVNDQDKMLMGKRNDTDKWTVPAGHIEKGECPFMGMARELKEESGLDAKNIELIRAGMKGDLLLYLFKIEVDYDQECDTSGDPDEECDAFTYEDPFDHIEELHVQASENWALKHWANN